MNFIPEAIEEYAQRHTAAESDILKELHRYTLAHVLQPRMISGHLQGRFLSLLSRLVKPVCVLEIGTYTGYSALCLAEGLAPEGVLHTIEINPELESIAMTYFRKAGMQDRIRLHIGHALNIIPAIEGPFDLVFIDADKENYVHYLNTVKDRIRPGGILIADNVLWSGQVLQPPEEMDQETKGLVAYSNAVMAEPGLFTVLLPIRDGLMLSIKC
jgi:predicted O-methyltransferase YrrM